MRAPDYWDIEEQKQKLTGRALVEHMLTHVFCGEGDIHHDWDYVKLEDLIFCEPCYYADLVTMEGEFTPHGMKVFFDEVRQLI